MCTISLCMIVKNEESVLARCLDSVRGIADEIILVDTGSTDATKDIARRYTDKVFDFVWVDDFAAARNVSFGHAGMDYCLWLDADDVIEEADRRRFLELKRTLSPDTDIVMLPYHTAFDGEGRPTFTYYRERLIRNHPAYRWTGAVHEVIAPAGHIVYGEAAVSHRKLRPGDPGRNLRIFENLRQSGHILSPREQFYYARELYYHERYQDAAAAFEHFLDAGEGWVENNIDACRQLSACYAALGRDKEALAALLRSFSYDAPRAEACCDLGGYFLARGQVGTAVFWYELALTRHADPKTGAFVSPDCSGYIPCIQLCVCYDRLGDRQKAAAYNDRAEAFKPGDPSCAHNRAYFENRAAAGEDA